MATATTPATAFPTLAQVKANYQAARERLEAELKAQAEEEAKRNTPEALAKLQAEWEQQAKEREEAEAKRMAAYPANFAKALVDYTQYLRETAVKAIEEASSTACRHYTLEELNVSLHEYGAKYEHGCCGEQHLGEGLWMKWKSAEDESIGASTLLEKRWWPEDQQAEEKPTPLETLKEELEAAGYEVEFNLDYNWAVYIRAPLV